jgi:F0F1-type ATP synthase membrane subunit c/vacuolar-type H+-ATPase subunit K
MANGDRDQLKRKYLAVNLIGLIMIASVFLYAAVVEIIKRFLAPFAGFALLTKETVDLVRYLLGFAAMADFFLIRIILKKYSAAPAPNLPLAAIITFSLCESVALYGLVLFLLAGSPLDFYIFMTISLAFFYIYFPKYDKWEKAMGLGTDQTA